MNTNANAPRPRVIETTDYTQPPATVELGKGAEMGRFKLGSTAIVLLPKSSNLQWTINAGDAVRMGQGIAIS